MLLPSCTSRYTLSLPFLFFHFYFLDFSFTSLLLLLYFSFTTTLLLLYNSFIAPLHLLYFLLRLFNFLEFLSATFFFPFFFFTSIFPSALQLLLAFLHYYLFKSHPILSPSHPSFYHHPLFSPYTNAFSHSYIRYTHRTLQCVRYSVLY